MASDALPSDGEQLENHSVAKTATITQPIVDGDNNSGLITQLEPVTGFPLYCILVGICVGSF